MPYELIDESPNQKQGSSGPESTLGFLGRTGARTLARASESIAGLPGDIASAGVGLANYGISKLTGKPGPIPHIPLPTSEAIRENITKPLTGEYLEPQGKNEQFYDDIIGDAAALLTPFPIKSKVPFAKAAAGALGRSAIGNTAKWAAEEVTGSPLVGVGVKIGSMALASTFGGRRALNELKKESYDKAFSEINPHTKFNLGPERNHLLKKANKIAKGDSPDKAFLLDRLRAINNISDYTGESGLKDAITLKQDWNKYLADAKLSKESRATLKEAVKMVNNGIKRYGEKNPRFYTPYKVGEELTGALQSTNYIQQILAKTPQLQESVKNPIVKHLLFTGGFYGASKLATVPQLIAGAGIALGAKESAQAYQLLSRSPVARKYYKDVIDATLKNDTKAIAKNLSKLDKAADQFSQKDNQSGSQVGKSSKALSRYELLP